MPLLQDSTLTLYGVVGAGLSDIDGFTAKDVRDALAAHGDGDITVNLNSGGGVALDGLAIYNALKSHPGRVVINIDAVAASAASLIAMAGDEIVMREGALMMIHDPRAITMGTARDLRKSAAALDTLAEQFRNIYAARTGLAAKDVAALMASEAWMDGDQAVARGFATRKSDAAALKAAAFDYSLYRNPPAHLPKGTTMPTPASPESNIVDKPWAANFLLSAEHSGIALADLNKIIASADTIENAKDALIDAMAQTRNVNKPSPFGRRPTEGLNGAQTFDNPEFLGQTIADVMYARMSGKAPESAARELAGRSLLDLGAMLLQARGERVSWASRDTLASRIMMAAGASHSTSDFPILLTQSGQRVLLDSYKAAETPLKLLARRRDANDFRAISTVRLSEMPQLDEVGEGGEIKYGTRSEAKESFAIKSYAKIFGLTRQAVINDDLNAFADSAKAWGQGAAQTEASVIVALFTANSGDGINLDDSSPVYTTGRGNKAAAGTAISTTDIAAGRQAMRETKGLDGKTPVSLTPKYLVVGPANETAAEQILSSIYAAHVADANPFAGKLQLLVEPRFTGNAWRLFADSAEAETLAIGYLNGHNGPILSTREGWTMLGTEFRCVLDFGAGFTGWRGTYLNAGN
jgi:ATP-dependent protease ClpP protease subunit